MQTFSYINFRLWLPVEVKITGTVCGWGTRFHGIKPTQLHFYDITHQSTRPNIMRNKKYNIYQFCLLLNKQVLEQMSPNQKHIERVTALRCPNKNRNSNYLPRKCQHVMIKPVLPAYSILYTIADKWRVILRAQTIETTYINASFVNVRDVNLF